MPSIVEGRKRKHKTVQLSDSSDDEQSGSSPVSTGSKRARHTRDASQIPPRSNGHRQPPHDYHDDSGYEGGEYQPGSIVRVKLKNFVTYTAVEFHLGPSLNMIIGPNGTGKSTLVCAICLGLGWSPQHLGRAKEIGEFVKYGHHEAEIEIELASKDEDTANPIITRIIRKEGNKSVFLVNGKSVAQKEATAFARSFDIQIDNLCQFLPQDRVVEFASLDPVPLMRETLRAAAPAQMVEWHDKLKDLRIAEKRLEVQQENETNHLQQLQAKQIATKVDVDRWNQRQDLQMKAQALEKCKPVINTKILEAEIGKIKSDIQTSKRELDRFHAEVGPARQAQLEMEAYRDQVSQVARSRRVRFNAEKATVDSLPSKIETEQQSLTGFTAQIDAEKKAEKQRREDMNRIESVIAGLNHRIETNPVEYDPSTFDSRKSEVRTKRSAADRRRVEYTSQLVRIKDDTMRLRGDLKQAMEERERLNTQRGQNANLLKTISKHTAIAWEWLEQNMATLPLKDQVYAPAILSCSVPDPGHAAAVESQLRPQGDLTAITCTNAEDVTVISDKLLSRPDQGGLGLHHITIRAAPKPRAFYRSPLTQEELQQVGLDAWIVDYIQGPDPVLAMLCDSAKLHRAAFGAKPVSNEQYAALERKGISKWVSGSEVYQITTRREYGASSTNVTQLQQARFFCNQPVDTEEKRRLDEAIDNFTREMAEMKSSHETAMTRFTEAKAALREAEDERAEIQVEQDRIQKAYAEWEGLPRKIATKEAELQTICALSAETNSRIKHIQTQFEKISLKLARLTIEYAESVNQLRTMHESYVEAEIRLVEASSEVEGYRADNAEISRMLEQKTAQFNQLKERKESKRAEYLKQHRMAQKIITELSNDEKEVVKKFSTASSTEDLENEIISVNARLAMLAEGNPHAVTAYENRAKQIQKMEEDLQRDGRLIEETKEEIASIRELWEPRLDQLVTKISDEFSNNCQQIGCAGQVGVYKDEDFENWSIQIQVRFREGESLAILDSHRQSGGERAVSTIFYLMALQELARSPFRVVDEINQGMDPRNERMVHERMVDIACREHTSQYFLITPKLLNDLKFHPKMKVHCIASGEHMPDSGTDLNFQHLAELSLRVRKGAVA